MHITHSIAELADVDIHHAVLGCGVFDGMHRGHQYLFQQLSQHAQQCGAQPVVVTFSPHPQQVIGRGTPHPGLLIGEAHRLRLFEAHGAAATTVLTFTSELAAMSPEAFVESVLLANNVKIAAICVGQNWRFGKGAAGTTELLAELGRVHGFSVIPVAERKRQDEVLSSTRIRQAIASGNFADAATMLGRPYSILGPVISGRGIGGPELNCPTANVSLQNIMHPPAGIYAASARRDLPNADWLPAIAYLGDTPTFPGQSNDERVLEVHIFDFAGDLYGQDLEVQLLQRIRGDEPFPSSEALAAQIQADIQQVRAIHNLPPSSP